MEIGSEFWTIESSKKETRFFVAGRTALDFIIRDIMAERTIGTVFLPALCCHSMIEPFLRNGLSVEFFDINFENGILKANVPNLTENDLFFHIKYFGYDNQSMGNLPEIKKTGCIIVNDTTHSWLTDEGTGSSGDSSDYTFVSYRKWTGLTGFASATKNNGKFNITQHHIIHEKYENMRLEAQRQKKQYINNKQGEKESFLSVFSEAEELLDSDYTDYSPTAESLCNFISMDKNLIKSARRKNAQMLLNGLSGIDGLSLMFPQLGEYDVPLSVPILVGSSLRNDLRKHLISNQIYCPVHWPISELHHNISQNTEEIYKSQLSLICDQRYNTENMEHILKCTKDFFNK